LDVAFIILENDNITLIIAVEVSKNITLIEIPLVHEGRNIDWLGLVCEVLKRGLTHLDVRSVMVRFFNHNFFLSGFFQESLLFIESFLSKSIGFLLLEKSVFLLLSLAGSLIV
jgi:hypothetical protein